jgi:hypothetical protein
MSVSSWAIGNGSLVVGIRGGINYSRYTKIKSEISNYRSGGAVGVFGEFGFSNRTSLSIGLAYSHKGKNYEMEDSYLSAEGLPPDFDMGEKLAYLNAPFLLTVSFPLYKWFAWNFSGGAYVAYLLDARFYMTGTGIEQQSRENTSAFNPFDVGGIVGTGISTRYGRAELTLDVRLELGLTSVFDFSFSGDRNNTFSVLVGIGFVANQGHTERE